MALEPRQTYRLVPRGDPGLTCDSEGVALGGIPVAWSDADNTGQSQWKVRSPDEIGEILTRAYGLQRREVVDRCHRGLRRVAARLKTGDLAHAGVEALMLRLPGIDPEGMAKLASLGNLSKGGDASEDEPRLPAGQPGGGQWTTGGGAAGASSEGAGRAPAAAKPDRTAGDGAAQRDSRGAADETTAEIPEFVAPAPVAQSRRQGDNGFYVNSAGGGVFFIPTTVGGPQVRPTEVHAEDASAFQVSWDDNGVINLESLKEGTTTRVPVTTPEEVQSFNATTGRSLGVAIYTFPGTPLGSPDAPPTTEEERALAGARAAFLAGREASEQSLSGRITTGAVLLATALPFLALAPAAAEAPIEGPLNTAEELWPRGSDEVSAIGPRATAQGRAYEVGVRSMYPETTDEALRFGEAGQYRADAVAEVFGKETAIDAKYVDDWGSSIRNPDSAIGDKPFAVDEQQSMVAQAKRYDEWFDGGSIYHTNSPELASYYYRLFRAAGVTKARFLITPAGR